jgi:hypothetical protein
MSLITKTQRPMGCGKSRAVESEENQMQVFLPSHRPWKSRKSAGFPLFPQPRLLLVSFKRNREILLSLTGKNA